MIKELLRDEAGQSTGEYVRLTSVIVISIVAEKILSDGKLGRVGTTR
jgi:hypothetical protein